MVLMCLHSSCACTVPGARQMGISLWHSCGQEQFDCTGLAITNITGKASAQIKLHNVTKTLKAGKLQ